MKKTVSIVVLILTCLILLYIVFRMLISIVGGLIIGGAFSLPIDKQRMEKIFCEDRENLIVVRDYLINLEEDVIYISDEDVLEIADTNIAKTVERLFKRGYDVILKDENAIYFQRWSNLDSGRGIIYLIDDTKPINDNMAKIESLSEKNWYYCVSE